MFTVKSAETSTTSVCIKEIQIAEHKTRVKVTLNVYVNLETDNHPEDIDKDTVQDLLTPLVTEKLKSLSSGNIDQSIIDWEYEGVINN
jgi:hypothetical protein